ncbi:MFS transporter [Asanoa siamensis]|uniref:MFS transporter n=1 Tax=Asanoa siamensis TaxID=926357 RepID=A0ABQ4D5E0_9ACTN|nr:MFS transporter [Asanoa siamensis]GIF78488.1 MFS transporter [Asanoa siamensis]
MSLKTPYAAVAAAFLLCGLIFSTSMARLPALQHGLALSDGELAVALVGLNGGAVLGLQAGAVFCHRLGSRTTLRAVLPAFSLLLIPIAMAPTMPALVVTFAASAAVNGVIDVAINANGVAVERQSRRVVLSRLHAMLTLGGIIGAAASAVAAHFNVGVKSHFTVTAVAGAVAASLLTRGLTVDGNGGGTPTASPSARYLPAPSRATWVIGFGGLGFCVMLAEGSANDWTAIYLHDLGGNDAFAASGVAIFLATMTVGRLAGDHIRQRIAAAPLVRGAALLAAIGLGTALLIGHPLAGLAGFAMLGLGLSVTLPVILGESAHRAARSGKSPAATVARVSTIAYLGSFLGPGLIGALAIVTSLETALLLPVAAAAVTGLGAGLLAPRQQSTETGLPARAITYDRTLRSSGQGSTGTRSS